MKKVFLFFATCCIALGAMAQIQVNSNGELLTNQHSIYLLKQSTSQYGFGLYKDYVPSNSQRELYTDSITDIAIISDRHVDFLECDGNTLAARFNLNYLPSFDFFGKIRFHGEFWSKGIMSSIVPYSSIYMPCLYPASHWYGALGTADKRYASAYLDHIYVNTYTTYPSDGRVKENVKNLENGLNKVLELRPISYDIKESFYDSIPDKEGKQYAMEHGGKNRIGFISQEVQQVMPELVSEEPQSGLLGINTIDMIPYLVQAIKEQQKEIEELKEQLNKETGSAELKSTSVFTEEKTTDIPASLSQNKPNPFSSETRIEMYVPQSVANATLYIYDLQGKQVKSIIVTGRGATFETIHASELQAGLYIYSLVTDGKLVGSKQMVLTE